MKRRVYAGVGRVAYAFGLHRLLLRERAAVAVFHRVEDGLRGNPITLGRNEFRWYCDFFERHFKVVPLSELLALLAAGKPLGGRLAITFDDGYLDNYEFAAPELERRGMTASFFVCSGFIGTQRVPVWDAERGIRSRWMTWDMVRDLHRRGFEIGVHTARHVDLGQIAQDEARDEIEESRQEIEQNLGAPATLFCYPFGRRWHLHEANRQVVKSMGFACCMGSYGGTIGRGDDPHRLQRAPVHPWHLSPYQYGLELLFNRPG